MYSRFASRLAVTTMLTLAGSLTLKAQAQAPSSTSMVFNLADGQTVSKAAGVVKVEMTAADAAGLRSVAITGGYTSALVYPGGARSAFTRLYFYASYFPVGDYTFRATVTNSNGTQAIRAITLHLVN